MKADVRATRDGRFSELSTKSRKNVGLWWLKTLLLLVHPDCRWQWEQTPAELADATRWPAGTIDYKWLADGGTPPAGLQMWIAEAPSKANRDRSAPESCELVDLQVGDRKLISDYYQVQIGDHVILLLYHPGWSDLDVDGGAMPLYPLGDGREIPKTDAANDARFWTSVGYTRGFKLTLVLALDQDPFRDPLNLVEVNEVVKLGGLPPSATLAMRS